MIPMARPRIVVDGGEIFYVFRDEERGAKSLWRTLRMWQTVSGASAI